MMRFFRKNWLDANHTRSRENRKGYRAETGIDVISQPAAIRPLLEGLHKDRVFITLEYRGYESGNTIMVECSADRLRIAIPPDWPATARPGVLVKAVFYDDHRLWYHFQAKLVAVDLDTLTLEWPTEIHRLQRRNYFRVLAPDGSRASFLTSAQTRHEVVIRDISAGGIRVGADKKLALEVGAELSGIALVLASFANIQKPMRMTVGQGRLVRIAYEGHGLYCYGYSIAFAATGSEKSDLLHAVRRLELEYLKTRLTG